MKELALIFLRLGLTAFGGPAAHIALMEQEFVRKRQWLTSGEFLDLIGAASLIPGPSSSEVAIFIGQRRAGWRGLLLAGVCFILPASLIVGAVAWAYVRYHTLPAAAGILYGIKPVIIAIVLQAIVALSRTAVKSRILAIMAVLAFAAALAGVNIPLLLFATGLLSMAAQTSPWRLGSLPRAPCLALGSLALLSAERAWATAAEVTVGGVSLVKVFLSFLKIGCIQFGSGYVLLAFLRADFVERWHWLSESQLVDAVAVGQFTPGPVFTTATFIGYLLKGPYGAIVATVGIFLPAFVLVAVSGALIPKLRHWRWTGAFLDGVNIASLALMAAVTWNLGKSSIVDIPTALLATFSAYILIRYKPNSAYLIVLGGAAGFGLSLLRG